MLFERAPDHLRSLLLDALVTYSDSCTLPNLTPSCPYFVQSEAGPTCREQCRDLIAQSGVADRRVRLDLVPAVAGECAFQPRDVRRVEPIRGVQLDPDGPATCGPCWSATFNTNSSNCDMRRCVDQDRKSLPTAAMGSFVEVSQTRFGYRMFLMRRQVQTQ